MASQMDDRAFNAGCDARLIGRPLHSCVYPDRSLRIYWMMGWRDVDRFWGVWAARFKRAYPQLPPVRENDDGDV